MLIARALLALLALSAVAHGRVKVDRYFPATLPEVQLWVTLLDEERPVLPEDTLEFSVHVNGQIVRDEIEWETTKEHGAPMAVVLMADARSPTWWGRIKAQLPALVDGLPKDSIGFGMTMEIGLTRQPEKSWTTVPRDLPPTMALVNADGRKPRLYQALKRALRAFPLKPGLEPEPWEGESDPWPKDRVFPDDRMIFLISDGHLEGDPRYRSRRMRAIVNMARRRDVRIMAIGIDGPVVEGDEAVDDDGNPVDTPADDVDPTAHLPVLEVIARKTGGTYRRAHTPQRLAKAVPEMAAEVANRYVLTFEAEGLRRGDMTEFSVTVQMPTGGSSKTRGYTARISNELGLVDRVIDWISDIWEGLPWWARLLILIGVGLISTLIVLIIVVRRVKKRRKAAAAARAARDAALAARKPCAICGNLMMPGWTQCMFCAAEQAQVQPMRFRLTGRSGDYVGEALRFDREIIAIGSDPQCDVRVVDRGVASQHCGIRDRGDEFILTDFNSDTGTWVNGERVGQVILDEGDLIRVGDTEFVFGIEAT